MKKYKYVVVSGCSFSSSDNPNLVNPGETYGDLIAEHLGAKFYNLSMIKIYWKMVSNLVKIQTVYGFLRIILTIGK